MLFVVAGTLGLGCATVGPPKGPDCTEAHVPRADCHDLKGNCPEIEETLALCLARWPGEVRQGVPENEISQISRLPRQELIRTGS